MGTSWRASPVMITKTTTTNVTNLTASPHARMHRTDCRDSVMKTEMKTAHQSQTRIRETFSGAYSIGPRLLPRPKVAGAGRTSHADDGVPSLKKRGERGERRKILGRLTVMAVAVQLIRQVQILFSVTYIQYYAVPSPCRAIWCTQAQGEGWQAISIETGVAVVRDRDRCGAPRITAGGMGLPSCHIHQKALGSLSRPFSSPHHFCIWQIHFLLN